jgi:hypothetical protein
MPRSTLLAVVALFVTGCGGDKSGSKEPEAWLRKAAAAMREVRSVHLEGAATTDTGHYTYSADVARNGSLRYALHMRAQRLELVQSGGNVYMRANAAFWRANGMTGAVRLGSRWVKAPAAAVRGVAGRLGRLTPAGVARCLAQPTGDLVRSGTTTVDGRRAIVIVDRGNRPGDAPGRLYVQADGPALLLRAVQTGRVRQGPGTDPQCSDSEASPMKGDVRLSRFDEDVKVEVPKGALELDRLAGVGEQSA